MFSLRRQINRSVLVIALALAFGLTPALTATESVINAKVISTNVIVEGGCHGLQKISRLRN